MDQKGVMVKERKEEKGEEKEKREEQEGGRSGPDVKIFFSIDF